jgi:hypothetical protein
VPAHRGRHRSVPQHREGRETPGRRGYQRPIIAERVATCRQFVTELEALDQALVDIRARTVTAVDASKTTVIDVYGVGPLCVNLS